jgi:hypothetical protein
MLIGHPSQSSIAAPSNVKQAVKDREDFKCWLCNKKVGVDEMTYVETSAFRLWIILKPPSFKLSVSLTVDILDKISLWSSFGALDQNRHLFLGESPFV